MKSLKPFLLAGLLILIVGCGNNQSDDGLTGQEKQSASRLDQIAKSSGGDWEKVSQADRDFLINEISQGSEESAKKLLQMKAGPPKGTPGGPPTRGQ